MSQTFPIHYSLANLAGPSAHEFADRSDAFQQLVGDGLQGMAGRFAHSYPTKGQDGGIDSYIEESAPLKQPFDGLPLPAIVECKDHDDTLPNLSDNILSGWQKLREKLTRQAATGWLGLYQPWLRAKTYVYCISAVMPSEAVRESIQRAIQFFFESLPASHKPPIDVVRVLDWNDLRPWLDDLPSVRDSWVGTGALNILSLDEYQAGLTGFRRFLSAEALAFHSPPGDAPYHPQILFDKVDANEDQPGGLLVGAGGIGKTRTCFEVALLARANGWHVLYILPGEPAVTTEQVADAVLSGGPRRVLLVVEYLNQMQNLDLGALRRSLIPKARERGISLRLLANSRPGLMATQHPERDSIFWRADLALSPTQANELSRWAVKQTAPEACNTLGDEEVFRVCGHRPTIALLIAQQLETLARSGQLTLEAVSPARSGDLGHWLRRRLAEDNLTTPMPASIWENNQPPVHAVAAAAVMACTYDQIAMLSAVGSSVLAALGRKQADGDRIVKVLLELGWLEEGGPWLHAAHDVVTDELLEQVIFDGNRLRSEEFRAVLAAGLVYARSFGRLATALARLQDGVTGTKAVVHETAVEGWIAEHGRELGESFVKAGAFHSSYALGAVLGSLLWEKPVVTHWSDVVAPWLQIHQMHSDARHLLYRGLRSVTGEPFFELAHAAETWLSRWRMEKQASFVLRPLLHRQETPPDVVLVAVSWALDWVESFHEEKDAGFVLPALLERPDLSREHAESAVILALRWLEAFGKEEQAEFVLQPLLGRLDLGEGDVERVAAAALGWLEVFSTEEEAGYVLKPLLERLDLGEGDVKRAAAAALVWLEAFSAEKGASYVSKPLLEHLDLGETDVKRASAVALGWLEVFGKEREAQFVVHALLARSDLGKAASERAVAEAMKWLETFSTEKEAGYVLNPLLGHADLGGAASERAVAVALRWVEVFSMEKTADFVCGRLLERRDLAREDVKRAVAAALKWLETFGKEKETGFVLASLLERSDVDPEEAERGMALALQWLETFSTEKVADFVCARLLERRDLAKADAKRAVAAALKWLETFGTEKTADFVCGRLLGRRDLAQADAKRAEAAALRWPEVFCKGKEAGFVLQPLLGRSDLGKGGVKGAVAAALGWLETFCKEKEAQFVLHALLGRSDLGKEDVKRAVAVALGWQEAFGKGKDAKFVLAPLLERPDLGKEEASRVVVIALGWLETFNAEKSACFVLKPLLERPNMGSEGTKRAVASALCWLGLFGRDDEAGFVLAPLLKLNDLGPVSLKATANHARAWIDGRERQKEAGFIFVPWFASRQLSREEKVDLQSAAAIWLESNSSHLTGPVLAVALRLPTASPIEEATLLSRARSWLQAHSDKTSTVDAIAALIERPGISSYLRDEAIQFALDLAWHTNPNAVRNALEAARELLPKTSLVREEVDKLLDEGI